MDADRLEAVCINGWRCVCGKGIFHKGDIAIFFEIDSKLPEVEPFIQNEFLKNKKFKIKSQKIRGTISQGLLMRPDEFGWKIEHGFDCDLGREVYYVNDGEEDHFLDEESRFLTEKLGVTYAVVEDNVRKASSADKYKKMAQRHPKIAKTWVWKKLYKTKFGKKLLFFFFGKPKDKSSNGWPVGKFPGVSKTDQERCENMTWVLNDKTPFIRSQKCDGSSGTFILERKGKRKFEFYVCSRNVRMIKPDQECFYDENYYWEVAVKYDIENKLKDYLLKNPNLKFVCWQGEVCGPKIQKNPQGLTETHLFLFHMTDDTGRWDIRKAKELWESYDMEVVPIDNELYTLPDDFEEFKITADGYYDPSCCEGKTNCRREGFVYYKSTEPTFSFKNVSREYLLKNN